MDIYVPDYYNEFKCIADKCTHSCCIGWEIDIDSETLDYYKTIKGPLGLRLKDAIDMDGEPHFRLSDSDRCPFLNKNGLCDIICELGEEALCDICADHPRFRNYLTYGVEMGLGLCCEAAAELILTRTKPFEIISSTGADFPLTETEKYLWNVRGKLINIMQNRSMTIDQRHSAILKELGIKIRDKSLEEWCEFYLKLERLDEEWADVLYEAKNVLCGNTYDCEDLSIPQEQLTIYFLYRHMMSAVWDEDISEKVAFAVHACRMIAKISSLTCVKSVVLSCIDQVNHKVSDSLCAMIHVARMYSAEIEYSDENLWMVMTELGVRGDNF